jgi:hypothetical protein
MSASKSRFGGLGAVFFLVTLGAIAYYVQQQSIPEEREAMRKPATAVGDDPDEPVEDAPPVLPWQDHLDLNALEAIGVGGVGGAGAVGAPPNGVAGALPAGGTVASAAGATSGTPAVGGVDLKRAAYVQRLEDGHRILWTLDPVLQDSALTIFRNREVPYGAAVVLDLRDNSVLAFAGHSSHNPAVDPLEVLTTAWAPAASTFKLVTAASLLEHGDVTGSTKACWHGGVDGITDDLLADSPALDTRCDSLAAAVAWSHNVVIAKLAKANLDQGELSRTAHAFGFERELPFEFPLEISPAEIPEDEKERAKVAAGFWHVDMSPVHGAVLASIFARGGVLQPPHLVKQVLAPDGSDVTPTPPKAERVIASDVAKAVGQMMIGTTAEGTAAASFKDDKGQPFIPGMEVAGKTGSLTGKRAPALNYNWFIGYAPADKPEIAVAVIIANEPAWRIKSHYAARRLIQIYLERRDAIRTHRDVRLTAEGLVLDTRDAKTGAVLASGQKAAGKTAPLPTAAQGDSALPPVPGPVSPMMAPAAEPVAPAPSDP